MDPFAPIRKWLLKDSQQPNRKIRNNAVLLEDLLLIYL